MPKPPVGHVQGRSTGTGRPDDISLRDYIVDGEGAEESDPEKSEPPEKPTETRKPSPPRGLEAVLRDFGRKPGYRKTDERQNINYFGALDDIIADLYEKQGAAYQIVQAVLQQFEQSGNEVPFDEERFKKICGNLAVVHAAKEIAWLYGLGPVHADQVASLMIDKLFGFVPKGK